MFYKMMRKARKNQKGFTLVELMVVVVIIGILTAVAIPQFTRVTDSAEQAGVAANLRTIEGAIMMYRADEGVYPSMYTDSTASYYKEFDNQYKDLAGYLQLIPEGPADARYFIYEDTLEGRNVARAAVHGDVGGYNMPTTAFYLLENLPWLQE